MERDKLFQYFAGELGPEGIKEIKSWAEQNEENVQTLLRERRLYNMILLLPPDQTPATKHRSAKPSARYYFKRIATILAVALISSGTALFLNGRKQSSGHPESEVITVPAGQRVNVLLADGTRVWLNAASTLKYSPAMRGKKREVFLDGQAYFDVAKDEAHPFIVRTFALDIEVHGTQFDVCAYSKRSIFETALMSGSISAYPHARPDNRVTLKPNQRIFLQDGVFRTTRIDDPDIYRWKEGIYCFKDKKLSALFEDLERYYDCIIQYEPDPTLEKEAVTGKLRISDGIDQALSVLQHSLRFSYLKDKDSNNIRITTKP